MLGVNSSKKMVRPACPFFEGDKRCGAETALYDDARTMVRCRKGHLTDTDQMPVPAEEIAPPFIYRRQFRFDPKSAALYTAVAALVVNAIVEHL